MTSTSRREFVQATAISLIAATTSTTSLKASEDKPMTNSAFDYQHAPAALPFAAKFLNGISEKLI